MTRKTWRRLFYGATAFAAILIVAFAVVFQDGIVRFFATPRAPFQTVEAPPAPDYALRSAWLQWPTDAAAGEEAAGASRSADMFYIHSNAFYRRNLWNAPIDDPEADRRRRTIAFPNEAGPFSAAARIYAPLYREATLYSLFTHKYDGLAARELAYADIRRAFEVFLAVRDPERPVILAGYGQGGVYALGLLRDYFQGPINPLRRRLVAAYVIGASTPADYLSGLTPPMPVCAAAEQVRCVISYVDFEPRFDEEMQRLRARALIWGENGRLKSVKGENLVCVNPLSWTIGGAYEPPEKNVGAASATGLAAGDAPPPMPKVVGAACEQGILIVDNPKRRFLRRGDWFGAKWKTQPFNLFYYDIAANAAIRLAQLQEILKVEPEPLEPIGETIDLDVSPVNKAPE